MATAAVSAASAATVSLSFDFTGLAGFGQTYSQTIGGVDLVVDGARFNGATGAVFGNSVVTWRPAGLGARSGSADTRGTLDGNGFNEILSFMFSRVVKIEQITFAAIERLSRAEYFVDGGFVGAAGVTPLADLSGAGYLTDVFGIGARTEASSFRIASLTVSYDDLAPVPLPAGGLLLLAGLGMMVVLRRRASRQIAL